MKFFSLAVFLFLTLAIGWAGSLITTPEIGGWYAQLNKPSWNPPNWVFGPVWTALYVLIAISGWLVWQRLPQERKFGNLIMSPYWVQLLLNFLWSIFFFGRHNPSLALVDIVLLATAIGLNIGTFSKVSRSAAYLLVPYFLWVCYATSLNAAIVALN